MRRITTDALREMRGQEGLILMGCGGNLAEWEDGINDWLTEEGILLNGSKFENVVAFPYQNMVCLFFSMADVELDIGKLAIWRLKTHEVFGSTWLSDFRVNQLGMEDRCTDENIAEPEMPEEQGVSRDDDIKEGPEPC